MRATVSCDFRFRFSGAERAILKRALAARRGAYPSGTASKALSSGEAALTAEEVELLAAAVGHAVEAGALGGREARDAQDLYARLDGTAEAMRAAARRVAQAERDLNQARR
jgi:hypothetical protein